MLPGIATVNTSGSHGFGVNNKITITGAGNTVYNGSFEVTEDVTNTRFKINIGVGTTNREQHLYVCSSRRTYFSSM